MFRISSVALLLALALVCCLGCGKAAKPGADVTEAGPDNWARLGPVGLCVDSVRVGRVRMGGGLGQAGQSQEEVLQVRTRLRLFDTNVVVKQAPLQRDGSIILGSGFKLEDSAGTKYKEVGGFGFASVKGRRSKEVELTADNPETADLITFEATAAKAEELILTIPGSWQEKQPDGKFIYTSSPGTFRFRIPGAMVTTGPKPMQAGPGNWYRIGPVGVEVTSVRLGKVKMESLRPFGGKGESKEDMLSVAVRFRLFDTKVAVKKPPFVPDGGFAFSKPMAVLEDGKGQRYNATVGSGFDRILGRQSGEVELSAAKAEVEDLLTFEAKAAAAEELTITLWPNWYEKKADGSWAQADVDDEFRFHLPRVSK